jgi:hypothetical protein
MSKSRLVGTVENDQFRLNIIYEDDSQNPRDWDNIGIMICWHKKYQLGDVHDFRTPADMLMVYSKKNSILIPLYLYDHGGLKLSTSSFKDPFDSGRVGYIVIPFSNILDTYGDVTESTKSTAEKAVLAELEVYNQYLNGDVYGYILERKDLCPCCNRPIYEIIDAQSAFYGSDFYSNGMFVAISQYTPELVEKFREGEFNDQELSWPQL